MTLRTLPLLLAVSACGWNHNPDQHVTNTDRPLWDPDTIVASSDGVYARLPQSGGVALVRPDGTFAQIDTRNGLVTRLSLTPDEQTVIAFVDRYFCEEDDPRELRHIDDIDDCPSELLTTETELLTLVNGSIGTQIPVDNHFNAISYSNDGSFAVAFLDPSLGFDLENAGVINLTSVLVMNLANGSSTPLSVGFAADRVLFTDDNTRAVVLSQSSVALVDLTADPPTKSVDFPLTLDADTVVNPVAIDLTPDGRYALISASGRDDLYVLDLESPSINMVPLSGNPSDMVVVDDWAPDDGVAQDRTVLVYDNARAIDVLDHEVFDIVSWELDEPMTDVTAGEDFVLAYHLNGNKDAYRLDLASGDLVEYRLENPPVSLTMDPTEQFAVALTRAEGGYGEGVEGVYDSSPGMEILDLRQDKGRSFPYLLESDAVGIAFSPGETALYALVLQSGIDYLYQLDLYTGVAGEVDLSAPPHGIGALPGGTFFITHQTGMGMMSFYDPATGDITEVTGFALLGATDAIEFTEEAE
jgi:hypothetical protein